MQPSMMASSVASSSSALGYTMELVRNSVVMEDLCFTEALEDAGAWLAPLEQALRKKVASTAAPALRSPQMMALGLNHFDASVLEADEYA